jgi:hypothetical protein
MADRNFKVKSGIQVPALSTAGVVVTDSSGNMSSATVLPLANGGTGQTTANNALNALLPIQNESTTNFGLQSDGLNTFWGQLYYQVIQNSGESVIPRRTLNLIGATFEDDPVNNKTNVTIGSSQYSEVLLTENITGMQIL